MIAGIKNNYENKNTSFGMKFKFERLSPNGDWYSADREFFNSTYQLGIINRLVDKLKPQNDEFILKLDLPKTDFHFDEKESRCFFKTSYDMFVDIVRNNKKIREENLSEKNIILDYFNAKDRLEIHPKGPFQKLVDLITELEK